MSNLSKTGPRPTVTGSVQMRTLARSLANPHRSWPRSTLNRASNAAKRSWITLADAFVRSLCALARPPKLGLRQLPCRKQNCLLVLMLGSVRHSLAIGSQRCILACLAAPSHPLITYTFEYHGSAANSALSESVLIHHTHIKGSCCLSQPASSTSETG